jgi:hypothetical protein
MSLNIDELQPADVAKWCRKQAQKFEQLAEMIDSTFKPGGQANFNGRAAFSAQMTLITPQSVRDELAKKSLRISKLAEMFNVPEKAIENIVSNPENKITVGDRGWLKLAA